MVAFYLDEDTPEALAQTLVGYGHTAMTTTQADRKGAKDYEQLWFAAMRGWVLLTLNRKDYMLLHGAWKHWGVDRQHAGTIILM
jgi:3-mercaptopyruvate sulfurtransferase SseA